MIKKIITFSLLLLFLTLLLEFGINYFKTSHHVEYDISGYTVEEDYIKKSKTSIEELIAFAKKQHMSADIIRKLYSYKNPYKLYKKPFNKTEYLKTTILTINGEEVRPT